MTRIGPVLEFCIIPRFPTKPLAAQEDLQKMAFENAISWRNGIFPDFTRRQFTSQRESIIVLDAITQRQSYYELNVWGLLYYGLQLETKHYGSEGVHTFELAGTVLLYLRHAAAMYAPMGYSGPILLRANLGSILDVPFVHAMSGFTETGSSSPLDSGVELSTETTTQFVSENAEEVAKELYRNMYFALNWPRLVETEKDRENVLDQAYLYNNWKRVKAAK